MKKLLIAAGLALAATAAWAATPITTVLSNASYQVSNNDCKLITGTALTAARVLSLPYAGGTMIGQGYPASGPAVCQALEIWDIANGISSTNTLTIWPQSGDTINGVTSPYVVSQSGAHVMMVPISGSNWWFGNSDSLIYSTNITSTTGANSGVALTTATAANVLSISNLGMGIWDCSASLALNPQVTTVVSTFTVWLSSTSATAPTAGANDFQGQSKWVGALAGITNTTNLLGGFELDAGPMRFTVTAPTTVYAEALANFATAQLSAYGSMSCRNVN